MSIIYGQLKGLCLLHAIALEMFKSVQPTNNSDPDHQGPTPQNINSSELDHQGPIPQTQIGSSDFGYQEQSPSLHENLVHIPIQEVSWYNMPAITEEPGYTSYYEGEQAKTPFQEVSWYNVPCITEEPEHTSNYEAEQTKAPVQEVSWYAVPDVSERKSRSKK